MFDVIVITNGSELGEYILRTTWEVAQEIFRKYDIMVYVVPHFVRGGNVSIIVNGIEYVIKSRLSKDKIMDMILTALPVPSTGVFEVTVLGTWGINRDDNVGNASLVEI